MYMYTYTYMSKLINISDEVYRRLKILKGRESFSLVIRRLLEKRTNKEKILALVGKGEFDEEKLRELKRGWKNWSKKYV